jgi:hypothetical protein
MADAAIEIPADEYAGPAVVSTDRSQARCSTTTVEEVEVEVRLRGQFEPLDGRFHWYGRIATNEHLTEAQRSGDTVVLTTPQGSAAGRLSDVDPWGRFRISGTGRPPF